MIEVARIAIRVRIARRAAQSRRAANGGLVDMLPRPGVGP